MRIVIAGAGDVGLHLAKMLANENHDVVVIDPDETRHNRAKSNGDIVAIYGYSTSVATLQKANLKKTDLFIAVNPAENQDMNITSCLLAKQLGAKYVVARVDNEEYLVSENLEMFRSVGIDHLIYPERIASYEIIKLLGQTGTTEYHTFSGGKLLLIVIKLEEGVPIIGKPVNFNISAQNPLRYRAIAIQRNGVTIIPQKGEKYYQNDTVYIVSNREGVSDLLLSSGKFNIEVKNLMILGGGQIGTLVAKQLQDSVSIKIVEADRDRCEELTEILDNTLVLNADVRNTDLLVEEGINSMDAVVAVTGNSETNILASLAAKGMGVKKVIAEIENLEYIQLAKNIGVDTIINKKLFTASKIFSLSMIDEVQTVKYLAGSDAEVLEYIVRPGSIATKHRVGEFDYPRDQAAIAGVVRGDLALIVTDEVQMKPYDRVVVLALPSVTNSIGKYFS